MHKEKLKEGSIIVGETQSHVAIKVGNRIGVYTNDKMLQERQACIKQSY